VPVERVAKSVYDWIEAKAMQNAGTDGRIHLPPCEENKSFGRTQQNPIVMP